MPYKVIDRTSHIEVRMWGAAGKWDVLQALGHVRLMSPAKDRADVWYISDEVIIPFSEYGTIVAKGLSSFPEDFKGAKSAIVVSNALQYELARLYKDELKHCPFELGIFRSEEEALIWIHDERAVAT